MGRAKDIVVKPIAAKDANALVKRLHYSGKVVNSQLHLGVFMDGKCGGVMQFGPSMKKGPMRDIVKGTRWNDFIELNRMAFADWLPRNSESRALGYAFRWMRKQYPHIKWCVSFADGTQCGDGAIYRASGFVLTAIKKNQSLQVDSDGVIYSNMSMTGKYMRNDFWNKFKGHGVKTCHSWQRNRDLAGTKPLPGHMLRYIYFLDPTARQRLTVPVLPFSEIERRGAGMYRGKAKTSAGSSSVEHSDSIGEVGGSIPTPALNGSDVETDGEQT